MCLVCGKEDDLMICDKCHVSPKEMKDYLTALGIRRYDKLTKNRYK